MRNALALGGVLCQGITQNIFLVTVWGSCPYYNFVAVNCIETAEVSAPHVVSNLSVIEKKLPLQGV
jgi:hypothetical protein